MKTIWNRYLNTNFAAAVIIAVALIYGVTRYERVASMAVQGPPSQKPIKIDEVTNEMLEAKRLKVETFLKYSEKCGTLQEVQS